MVARLLLELLLEEVYDLLLLLNRLSERLKVVHGHSRFLKFKLGKISDRKR